MTKYYVDSDGNYIGAFSDLIIDGNIISQTGAVPEGASEVSTPPDNAAQKYDYATKTWLPLG